MDEVMDDDTSWRLEHPETPTDDGVLHTSARCRALASETFATTKGRP